MGKDLLHAVRGLWQSPVFALTAILTIALGIGASTVIFSVTNAVLLRPLPYKDPERLVLPWVEMRTRHILDGTFSVEGFMDLRSSAPMFEDLATLFTFRGANRAEDGTLEQISFGLVTPNFFRMLGAHVRLGRDFIEADGLPQPPADPAAPGGQAPPRIPAISILSYEYWQRRYGSDPNVVGRTINGALIVGILEPNFELLFPPSANIERRPEIWTALRLAYDPSQRHSIGFHLVGRLKPGASIEQAQSQAERFAAEERRIDLIERTGDYHVRLEPMHKDLVAEVRPTILALMGAVIFLLLIACANVANLLMVRASLRERELSVRTALGASRWRVMRQILVESVLIAGCGTVAGLGLARLGIHQLIVMGPTNLPRLGSIAIDPVVLAFSAAAGRGGDFRSYTGAARVASRCDAGIARKRSHGEPRRGTHVAQRSCRDRGGAVVRPADRIGADVPQFRCAAAYRPGVRFAWGTDVPARGRTREHAGGARCLCARSAKPFGGNAGSTGGKRSTAVSVRRAIQSSALGQGRGAGRSIEVPGGGLRDRAARLLRDDENAADRGSDLYGCG